MNLQSRATPRLVDKKPPTRRRRRTGRILAAAVGAGAMLAGGLALPDVASARYMNDASSARLNAAQRATLLGIAKDTWTFFENDVDPVTHLPLDNIGPGTTRGAYTSAANIGVYLESVVAANDLGLIDRPEARSLISATLTTVGTMQRTFDNLQSEYQLARIAESVDAGRVQSIDEATLPTFAVSPLSPERACAIFTSWIFILVLERTKPIVILSFYRCEEFKLGYNSLQNEKTPRSRSLE